jgi:hypothetical protein
MRILLFMLYLSFQSRLTQSFALLPFCPEIGIDYRGRGLVRLFEVFFSLGFF